MRKPELLGDRARRLPSALERRCVDRSDLALERCESFRRHACLLATLVGEMQSVRASRQRRTGRRRLAVTDEEDEGAGGGLGSWHDRANLPLGRMDSLRAVEREVVECRACPRLVAWREQVANDKVARFRSWEYWAKPVPGFGDPAARLLIVGLAPAAHGGNRTGRVFTGDRSGDFLFASLHRTGYASQPTSEHRDDGLVLTDCFITATVKCAPPQNKPTPAERDTCRPFLERELMLLSDVRVIVALGQYGWDAVCSHHRLRPKPRLRSRRGSIARPGPHIARLVPRQPAEHVHRQAHPGDARRRLRTCAPDRRCGRLVSDRCGFGTVSSARCHRARRADRVLRRRRRLRPRHARRVHGDVRAQGAAAGTDLSVHV